MKQQQYTRVESLRLILAAVAGAGLLYGQARDTGSVFGSIADTQQAVVPGAVVTLTNTATGAVRKATADSQRRICIHVAAGGIL